MSNHIEKANEYGVESLKLIMTLSSASLILTITFLKDVVGESSPKFTFLIILGWIFLLLSIFFSWFAIVAASSRLGENETAVFAFAKEGRETSNQRCAFLWMFPTVLSWFIPLIPSREKNDVLKYASSAQNYFVLGLLMIGSFSAINFQDALRDNGDVKKEEVEPDTTLDTSLRNISEMQHLPTFEGSITHRCKPTQGATVLLHSSISAYLPRTTAAPPCAGEQQVIMWPNSITQ